MAEVMISGRRLVVSTSRWRSDFAYAWTERPDLRVVGSLRQSSGMQPSTVTLAGYRDQDATGQMHSALPGKAVQWRLPTGEDGSLLMPHGMVPFSFVKIDLYDGDLYKKCVFLGMLTGIDYQHADCRMVMHCEDYRSDAVMGRVICAGSRFDSQGNYIADWGPHFNADGEPDLLRYGDQANDPSSNYFTMVEAQVQEGDSAPAGDYRDYWSSGDALNCLRNLFYDDPPSGGIDISSYLTWPKFVQADLAENEEDEELDGLFVDADTSAFQRVNDLNCRGRSLVWSIEQIVSAAGPYDWTLEVTGSDGEEKARLVVYPVASTDESSDGNLAMGALGSSLATKVPDIVDTRLHYDFRRVCARVRAVGALRRVDTSFETAGGSGVMGGSLAEYQDWCANGGDFPLLLTHILLSPSEANLNTVFTHSSYNPTGKFIDGRARRRFYPQMASPEDPIGIKVWRYAGGAWELLPENMQVRLGPSPFSLLLPPSARQTYWTWQDSEYPNITNAPTIYPFRATMSLDTDDRIFYQAEETGFALNVPPGQLYLPMGQRYQYNYRRDCWLPSQSGVPVENSSTHTEFGGSSDDVVRNDADELQAMASRMLKQVARPQMRGHLELHGLRDDVKPGWIVGQLTGGDGRDDLDIYQAVRAVELDSEHQRTKIYFEVL